ncbi:endo-1,4-beta-xylanase [Treponema bryantii]|uniref:Beta-xylanase n=1 Tax=Treponema bryantii TaxID=163 RepID=A0A1I3I063_9SPIR|nr:endo-1,4-beta-xylanase [Treponema bryantii]SFI41219.1 endo-1,4-beta-xylanase [Treponema bryantii]
MKRLFESYKDYFRVGAAISGIILMSDEEKAAHFEQMKARYEEFKKNFKPTPEFPEFKFPEPKPFPAGRMPDYELAASQFNLVVAENECKMGSIYHMGPDGKPVFDFAAADRLRDFAKKNGQDMRWHTLVWHNQSPQWIFKDEKGEKVSKEVLEERLKNYIFTVGERYRDDICSVDVVNECISDKNFILRDGADRSQWFDILGPEYVDKAFFWAKEAFPKSSLVINDYNLEIVPGKRQGMYDLVKGMKERGVPVDTVGLQMHINIEYPPVSEIEKTIELYGSLGLNVIVTEMEISMYADKEQNEGKFEPRKEYTPELLAKQAERYEEIFECFKKEAKAGILKDVVLWGITDRMSWKNGFPVPGRTDAPLLFDGEGKPKVAFDRLCKD